MKINRYDFEKGFTILEIILAVFIFVTFATGGIVAVISGLNTNRLGTEITTANQFTAEGIEAVRSIKNQSWTTLLSKSDAGNVGVGLAGGVWQFSGTSNSLLPDTRFNRVIRITSVQRDSFGNIVTSGGSNDPNTKKVIATTSWNFTQSRPENVVFTDYLTNWKAVINNGDGVFVYGESKSAAQPKYRIYTNGSNSFNAQASAGSSYVDTKAGKTFKLKTNPTKQEAITGYVNSNGVLRVLCFDGTTWSNEWTVTVGGTGTTQRFDIGYSTASGNVLVVYSTNNSGTNEMAYRTKQATTGCGSSNWSSATNISSTNTTGVVQWIVMKPSLVSSSNSIGIAWADDTSSLSAMEWTGSSFSVSEPPAPLETNLQIVAVSQDVQPFDLAMEGLTGNMMVVWSPNVLCTPDVDCVLYARYTTSWSATQPVPTVSDSGTNMSISANPNSNEMVMGVMDNSYSDLSGAYWSGTAWTGTASLDNTIENPVAGSQLVATGWLTSGGTTRSIIVYNRLGSTSVGWIIGNRGVFSTQTPFTPTPVFAQPQKWYDIQMDPKNKDRLMFSLSDNNSSLYAKRLVMTSVPLFAWTNSDGGVTLESNLAQPLPGPFTFSYWRN